MKFSTQQSALKEALNAVGRTVPASASHPILANVCITAKEDRLELLSFDGSNASLIRIDAEVEEEGSWTIPYRLWKRTVDTVRGDLDFFFVEPKLWMKSDDSESRTSFVGMPTSEFPGLPELDRPTGVQLNVDELRKKLPLALTCISLEETKGVLNGMHIKAFPSTKGEPQSKTTFAMFCTDGHRLFKANWEQLEPDMPEFEITLPLKAAKELQTMCSKHSEIRMDVDQNRTQVRFVTDDQTFVSRLMDGAFPQCDSLIPRESKYSVSFGSQEMAEALNRAGLVNVSVIFEMTGSKVEVSAFDESGEARTMLSVISTLDAPWTMIFNSKYFMQCLSNSTDYELDMYLNEPTKPALIRSSEDKSWLYLIMPIHHAGMIGRNVEASPWDSKSKVKESPAKKAKAKEVPVKKTAVKKAPVKKAAVK